MSLNRRKFIHVSAAALTAAAVTPVVQAKQQQPLLPVPPLLESHQGQPLLLTLQTVQWAFSAGNRVRILGVNGHYPGPTVRVRRGDNAKLIYHNRLDQNVAISVCGLQVPGSLAGGAGRQMMPGAQWAPVLPVSQSATTLWYRASTPQHSAVQVYNGLLGMWLVEDETSQTLALPHHYAVDDFPLILQDKQLNHYGTPEYQRPTSGGFLGNTLLVNGVENPLLQAPRSWLRLRLLNASNARRYLLQCDDNRIFYVIASDQGLLPAPVAVRQLALATGERWEILLDMRDGKKVTLTSGVGAGVMGRIRNFFAPSTELISNRVLTITAEGLLPLMTSPLPEKLVSQKIGSGTATQVRLFNLAAAPGINGQLWNAGRIDITTQQGNWERWLVRADSPQSFYIEGARFQIIRVNERPPRQEERGWKDTVWVDGEAELLVYFVSSSSERYPFIYGSQTLEMMDGGSAGQLVVNAVSN